MKHFLLLLCLFPLYLYSQNHSLSGRVSDAQGNAIPNASIGLKGTTSGTLCNERGEYQLNVPAGGILVFSAVGYQTREIPYQGQTTLEVVLVYNPQLLDEVVITAMGIPKRTRALGYSVTEVAGKTLVQTREPNLVTALSGQVAGVQINNSGGSPGGAAAIRIRGSSSLLGNNAPLFVLDGIPVDNSVQDILGSITNAVSLATPSNRAIDINPDDIETLTVLKGPAAAALYGIRAANGAVIITTKRGSSLSGRINVSYAGSFTLDEINRRMQPRQGLFSNGLNGQYIPPGQPGSEENWGARLDTLTYSSLPSPFDRNGRIVNQSDPRSNGIPVDRYDNIDRFFVKGYTQTHHLSVSGHTDQAGYYFSAGRLYQTGIIPTTNFYRTTFRFNGDYAVTRKLRLVGGINYIQSGADNRALMGGFNTNVLRALVNTPPNFDISNGLSKPWDNPDSYKLPATNARPWGDSRSYANGRGWDNPYWSLNMNPQSDQTNRFLGFAEGHYTFSSWLKSTFRYGIDSYTDVRKGGFSRGTSGVPLGTVNDVNYSRRDFNTDLIFTLTPRLGNNWGLSILLGHNYYSSYRNQINVRGDGLIIPGNFNISNASTTSTFNQTLRRKLVAGYADVRLDFRQWFFLELTGRNEWTSTLAKGRNSFFYPSLSTSWIFTEAFHLGNSWLNAGKLRATYAQAGNDADPYSLQTYYTNTTVQGWIQGFLVFPFNNQSGLSYGSRQGDLSGVLGNPNLKPERIRTWEIGSDWQLFSNRLGLELVYYNNLSRDQIIPASVPFSTGGQFSLINTGRVSNRGVELTLRASPIRNKDFHWQLTWVFSRNVSKVISLGEGLSNVTIGSALVEARGTPGQPYGALYGIDVRRDAEGRMLIDDNPTQASGQPNPNYGFPIVNTSFSQIGNPNPRFNTGLRSEFTFRNFSFSCFLDTRYGFDLFNLARAQMVFNGVDQSTENRGQSYVFEGIKNQEPTPNNIPVTIGQAWYRRSLEVLGLYVEKDLYWLRLRDVNLTYTLPASWLRTLRLARASLTLTARNFLLATNYSGSDPDLSIRTGQVNFSGFDFWTTPNTRSYGVAVNLTF